MTTLTNELRWLAFLDHFGLEDSGKIYQKFRLQSQDKKSYSDDDLIGRFNVTDLKVCTRLCMRIDKCESFIIEPLHGDAGSRPCSLYDDTAISLSESIGSRFYAIQQEKNSDSHHKHSGD